MRGDDQLNVVYVGPGPSFHGQQKWGKKKRERTSTGEWGKLNLMSKIEFLKTYKIMEPSKKRPN